MKREPIAEGVYQFKTQSGYQIGTADLPNFLKEMDNRKAPHYPRSKWQRKMKNLVRKDGKLFELRSFQPNTTPVQFTARHLSAKQQAKQQADHAAIMAMRKH